MSIRRRIAVIGALTAALVLSGCGAMPTSGEVQAGAKASDTPPLSFDILAQEPVPGSDPERTVEDFLNASTSPAGNYEVAQMFLTAGARTDWHPGASVIVDTGSRSTHVDELTDTTAKLTITTNPTAMITERGEYSDSDREPVQLAFELQKESDGEWRISAAPGGLVIERAAFQQVYQSYPLMFFDPTQHFLVPDQRWFPKSLAASRIASALVDGPTEALAPAVFSAFPEGTRVEEGSVKIDSTGKAVVSFSVLPQSDEQALGLMHQQLLSSLSKARALDLEMSLKSAPLSVPTVAITSTTVEARALVLTDGKLGHVSAGSDLVPITGLDAVTAAKPTSVIWQPLRKIAVIRDGAGHVQKVRDGAEPQMLDDRGGLIEPTIDPEGYVWSTPQSSPDGLRVFSGDGSVVDLTTGFTGLSSIQAMQMSRDGTRLAVVGTVDVHPVLAYFAVSRGNDGHPTAISEPIALAQLAGAGIDLTWLDDLTVAALVKDGDSTKLVSVSIGGTTERMDARSDARWISGVNAATSVRLLTTDGELFTRRISTWQRVMDNVQVLGTQQTSF